ncbi:hypothetical protein MauCBS54593_007834 [Microsporum audouinii]
MTLMVAGRIVVREIVSDIFGSASASPLPPPPYNTNINTSRTTTTDTLSPSSWLPDLGSCHCPITYVPMLPVECTGELFYATRPPEIVYTTITEVHTMKPIGTAPMGPPTLITPPPPCSTFSCPPSRCKMGLVPSLAPLISTVSVTKKTTILGIPSPEPPPSFKETGSDSAAGQNVPPTDSPTSGSGGSQPSGKSQQSEGSSPDNSHGGPHGGTTTPITQAGQGTSQAASKSSSQSGREGSQGGSQGGPQPTNSSGGPQSSGSSMVDPGPITSGSDPSHPIPTRTMFDLGGVPITIQETGSITLGNGPSRTTITSNTMPTTFAVDGHTFTVNPSEVIYLDTTFRLGADPTISPPLISGTSNPTDGGDDEGIRTDSAGNTISPRPTVSQGGSSSSHSLAVRTTGDINFTLIIGIIIAVIFGRLVGLL